MKPAKKAETTLQISKARRKETRQRHSLYDQAEKAERALYDAEAVAEAARRFWKQAQKAFVEAAGISERAQAKAVLIAARKFWEQSTNAISDAQQALDAARDALFSYNDKRVAAQSGEASSADMAFLNKWAERYNVQAKKKK